MRSPLSSSSTSLLAPVRRVGVGGALLGCGTGKVLLDLMTGLESLLAAAGRHGVITERRLTQLVFKTVSQVEANSSPLHLFKGSKWTLYSSSQGKSTGYQVLTWPTAMNVAKASWVVFVNKRHQIFRTCALHSVMQIHNEGWYFKSTVPVSMPDFSRTQANKFLPETLSPVPGGKRYAQYASRLQDEGQTALPLNLELCFFQQMFCQCFQFL